MTTPTNPYAGATPKGAPRASSRQLPLAIGCLAGADRRPMLVSWFERDLSAWEARTGHRVTIRAAHDRAAVEWRVDDVPIASTDLSDVVYGRRSLDLPLAA